MPDTGSSIKTIFEINRVIGHIKGKNPGPTLVFFGGIHGNEPAGVFALKQVLEKLNQSSGQCFGELFAIAGNLNALKKAIRFEEEDLNRIWYPDRLDAIRQKSGQLSKDEAEMLELHKLIMQIMEVGKPPLYFFDLHTTSGKSEPFLVVNDSLLNRKFTKNYPLPIIMGIEEYLSGALLSYLNEWGYIAFGYESGQHNDSAAVTNAVNFIWYTLHLTGFFRLRKERLKHFKNKLYNAGNASKCFYEIYYQHLLDEENDFKMQPGFVNFQLVQKGRTIAHENKEPIVLSKKRQLFMPLYQKKGVEGFYFVRKIPRFFLFLSKNLRWLGADALLVLLPGIGWASSKKDSLLVDRNVARFFAKSIFHLFGYRAREVDKDHFVLKNRERNSNAKQYKGSNWY